MPARGANDARATGPTPDCHDVPLSARAAAPLGPYANVPVLSWIPHAASPRKNASAIVPWAEAAPHGGSPA